MKVAIDARVRPGTAGGVAVAVKGLLQGLARLDDGDEEYVVVSHGEADHAWLTSLVGSNQRVVPYRRPERRGLRARTFRALRPLSHFVRRQLDRRVWPEVPVSDGFYESLGCDVLHAPTQNFVLCALPTIYNPHDLQHLRYPQFFTPDVISWRETIYPAGCRLSHTVVVGSDWIKQDVVRRYGVDPDKVQVIPEAPPTETAPAPSDADLGRVRDRYRLHQPYLLYPGVAWPHKNHLGLFRALAHLRDQRGLAPRVLCTGSRFAPFWPRIEAALREHSLSGQVEFIGYVPDADLRPLYRMASGLVFPSLYEASSLPIFEAWLDDVPVACSNAAALPQQVADAALLFDPHDPAAMAEAIGSLVTDTAMQRRLRERGRERLTHFDFLRTAKAYRAVYRRAADRPLTEEDRWLLQWDWMREHGSSATPTGRASASVVGGLV